MSKEEAFFHGPKRGFGSLRVAFAGNHGPGLRERVYLRLSARLGTQRFSIIEIGAAVPAPIPGILLNRCGQTPGFLAPLVSLFGLLVKLQQLCEVLHDVDQEPGQPHAFAFALDPHAVQTIVPIAAAD